MKSKREKETIVGLLAAFGGLLLVFLFFLILH